MLPTNRRNTIRPDMASAIENMVSPHAVIHKNHIRKSTFQVSTTLKENFGTSRSAKNQTVVYAMAAMLHT